MLLPVFNGGTYAVPRVESEAAILIGFRVDCFSTRERKSEQKNKPLPDRATLIISSPHAMGFGCVILGTAAPHLAHLRISPAHNDA